MGLNVNFHLILPVRLQCVRGRQNDKAKTSPNSLLRPCLLALPPRMSSPKFPQIAPPTHHFLGDPLSRSQSSASLKNQQTKHLKNKFRKTLEIYGFNQPLIANFDGTSGGIETATSYFYNDNQKLGKFRQWEKGRFGEENLYQMVKEPEEAVLKLLTPFLICTHFSSAVQTLTDFKKLFDEEVRNMGATNPLVLQNHPSLHQFREAIWYGSQTYL
ncbi:hypothetical protein C5167_028823 [Papaver somniferum]|nr:hypothetical protein C5167_028823 [Papaver somniferum]